MSTLRSSIKGTYGMLAPELRDTLRRNGMQAEIVHGPGGAKLVVQSHDSPANTYDISEKQYYQLTDGGTNSSDKQAYNTFVSIVKNDYDCPKDWIHARNAGGSVVMGLHGYRQDVRGYGGLHLVRGGYWSMQNPYFLGWEPRHAPGYHGRRIGGAYVLAGGAPGMIPVRRFGEMRPGELTSGGYGFYYNPKSQPKQPSQDVLQQLSNIKVEDVSKPRSTEPAIPYSELWGKSQVTNGFTNMKLKECLDSHGLLIDTEKKTLTVQSNGAKYDKEYQLSDEEYRTLMNNRLDKVSLQQRVDVINKVIGQDFEGKVTVEMLNSKERISLPLKAEVAQDYAMREEAAQRQQVQPVQGISDPLAEMRNATAAVDGATLQNLNETKGWFREGAHGREVTVGEIWVEPVREKFYDSLVMKTADGHYGMVADLNPAEIAMLDRKEATAKELFEKHMGRPLAEGEDVVRVPGGMLQKDEQTGEVKFNENPGDIEPKFQMSAVINGQVVTHEISEKDYNKFLAQDDYHRMKLFSKTFGEVDMKTLPGMRVGFMQGLGMAFDVIRGLSDATVDVARGIGAIRRATSDRHPYFGHPPVGPVPAIYYKPGVDTLDTIAQRAFDEGMRQNEMEHMRGIGI